MTAEKVADGFSVAPFVQSSKDFEDAAVCEKNRWQRSTKAHVLKDTDGLCHMTLSVGKKVDRSGHFALKT